MCTLFEKLRPRTLQVMPVIQHSFGAKSGGSGTHLFLHFPYALGLGWRWVQAAGVSWIIPQPPSESLCELFKSFGGERKAWIL